MNSISGDRDRDHLEMASLYALGVLSPGEVITFEAHLADCSECRHEIETLGPVIESFAFWSTDLLRPSASLWKRLSQRIAAESSARPVLPGRPPEWEAVAEGIFCKVLAEDAEAGRVTMLVRLAPGTDYPPHQHGGNEELYLLDGELLVDDRKLYPGDYIQAEAGSVDHRVWSETGCTCLLLTSTKDVLLQLR